MYGEAWRTYHNMEHIGACLTYFDRCRDVANHPDAIEMAIWFHDCIYEVGNTNNEALSRDWFLEVLANPNKMLFVAEAGGRVAGQILVIDSVSMDDPIYRPRRYLEVDELAVLTPYRRQGVGQRLMRAAEQFAAERGITTIELNVWEGNLQALSFYERLGYRTIRRRMARDLA